MHTQLAPRACGAKQRLELLRPPWPGERFGRRPGEGLGHRAVVITHDTGIAEHPPCQGYRVGLRQGGEKVRQGAGADMDVHKLINIAKQHPIGRRLQRVAVRGLEHGPLRPFLMWTIVADMGQPAKGLQSVQHGVGAITALIGKDQHIGEPHGAVMRKPLDQKRALVLHTQNSQRPHLNPFHP